MEMRNLLGDCNDSVFDELESMKIGIYIEIERVELPHFE